MQDGFIWSFSGKLRMSNSMSWFATLQQAKVAASIWEQDYNQVRPHSNIGRMPHA